MLFRDPIYGRFVVKDSVISDLIKSYPVQRIKGVTENCLPKKAQKPELPYYSRYDHSVGCMLLLRKLGAGLEEQIAGLLHDVSHGAFSHAIDAAFGDHAVEDYQDKTHRDYIMGSALPEILLRYGYDPSRISDPRNFPLLERNLPALCADRVDYTLRDLYYGAKTDTAKYLASGLITVDNEIVFRTRKHARLFGTKYLECRSVNWAEPEHVAKTYLLGDIIRSAEEKGVISFEDIYTSDSRVLAKIRKSGDRELSDKMRMLFADIRLVKSSDNFDYILKSKRRYVDPKYVEKGGVRTLSSVDQRYRRLVGRTSAMFTTGMRVRIVARSSI